jgi:hypothetical protein
MCQVFSYFVKNKIKVVCFAKTSITLINEQNKSSSSFSLDMNHLVETLLGVLVLFLALHGVKGDVSLIG